MHIKGCCKAFFPHFYIHIYIYITLKLILVGGNSGPQKWIHLEAFPCQPPEKIKGYTLSIVLAAPSHAEHLINEWHRVLQRPSLSNWDGNLQDSKCHPVKPLTISKSQAVVQIDNWPSLYLWKISYIDCYRQKVSAQEVQRKIISVIGHIINYIRAKWIIDEIHWQLIGMYDS